MAIIMAMIGDDLNRGNVNLKSDVFEAERSDMRLQNVLSTATKDLRTGGAATEQVQGMGKAKDCCPMHIISMRPISCIQFARGIRIRRTF